MDSLSSLNSPALYLPLIAAAVLCLLIGFFVGNRRSIRIRRQLQREHNEQFMALLDAKAKYERVQKAAGQQARKDRLLSLTLKKLKEANESVEQLTTTVRSQEKRHFMKVSQLKLSAVDAKETAVKATSIAQQAMEHLRNAKHNSSSSTSSQKSSYGVNQDRVGMRCDTKSPVPANGVNGNTQTSITRNTEQAPTA